MIPTIPAEGWGVKQVRAHYELGCGSEAQPHAQRPVCCKCQQSVLGKSYHHGPDGLVCHACEWGRPLVVTVVQERPKRDWRNSSRPTFYCIEKGCEATVTKRNTRCRPCAIAKRAKRDA